MRTAPAARSSARYRRSNAYERDNVHRPSAVHRLSCVRRRLPRLGKPPDAAHTPGALACRVSKRRWRMVDAECMAAHPPGRGRRRVSRVALRRRQSTAGGMPQHGQQRPSGGRPGPPSRRCVGCWRWCRRGMGRKRSIHSAAGFALLPADTDKPAVELWRPGPGRREEDDRAKTMLGPRKDRDVTTKGP